MSALTSDREAVLPLRVFSFHQAALDSPALTVEAKLAAMAVVQLHALVVPRAAPPEPMFEARRSGAQQH
jgi:hypothetical protein